MTTESFTGIVLTGGSSRRMGQDKSVLVVDGVPLAARVAAALTAAGAVKVLAVGGAAAALERHGLVPVADRWPGAGPLGGMITGLAHVADEEGAPSIAVVASCDLPRLTDVVVARLVEALAATDPARAMGAVPVVGGIAQTQLVAVRVAARPHLSDAFAGGVRAPKRALAESVVHVELGGVEAAAVADVDTPDDLAAFSGARRPRRGSAP